MATSEEIEKLRDALRRFSAERAGVGYLGEEGLRELIRLVTNRIEASGGGGDYLPLSGGTLTGDLTVEGTTRLNAADTADALAEAGVLVVGSDGTVRKVSLRSLAKAIEESDAAIELTYNHFGKSPVIHSGDNSRTEWIYDEETGADYDSDAPRTLLCVSGSDIDVEVNGVLYEGVFGGSDTGQSWEVEGLNANEDNTIRIIPRSGDARIWSSRWYYHDKEYQNSTRCAKSGIVSWDDWGLWKFADCTAMFCASENDMDEWFGEDGWSYPKFTTLPADTRGVLSEVKSFDRMFAGNLKLAEVPAQLFSRAEGAESFAYTFYNCSGLTSIPSGLFDSCPNVTSFQYTFSSCSGLTSLPENLFANNTAVTSFQYTFQSCSGLTSLPENLFANDTAASFQYTFDGCSKLASIPEALFNVCTGSTNFQYAFRNCTALTSIPENLFEGAVKARYFDGCFYGCSGITRLMGTRSVVGHKSVLFYNNREVTSFYRTFYNCTGLGSVYSPRGYSSDRATDNDVPLWEREDWPDYYSKPTSYSQCFYKCEGLTDYDDIPSGWK